MDWLTRMSSTISYAARASMAANGDITYSTIVTARARIMRKERTFVDKSGEQRQTTHLVATPTNIQRGTRVWLPGSDTGVAAQSHVVLQSETTTMLDGSYQFYLLTLGR